MERSYRAQFEQRFSDRIATGEGVEGSLSSARSSRERPCGKYANVVPSDALLALVTAAALSASAKSDFQQATVLRVADAQRREAIGAMFPAIPCDQQRAPDRFGYADFDGWSEDAAHQAASPDGAAFPVYLRAHGFTLDQ